MSSPMQCIAWLFLVISIQICLFHREIVCATTLPSTIFNDKNTNARSMVLFNKLIAGYNQLPVERRKAVTIGFNRWLRPLTIQVPDVISNLLPSSSNIIKVHDDPKNKTQNSEPQTNANPVPNQLLPYDPFQLITNFEQNSFAKGLANNPQAVPGFSYSNVSFGIDDNRLSAMPSSLFSAQASGYPPGQLSDKFQTIPLFQQDETYPNIETVHKKTPFYSNMHGQNDDVDHLHHLPNHQRHNSLKNSRFPMINDERNKQSYDDMVGSYHPKETYRPSSSEFYQSSRQHKAHYQEHGPHSFEYGDKGYGDNGQNVANSDHRDNSNYYNKESDSVEAFDDDYPRDYENKASNERPSAIPPFYNKENEHRETSFYRDFVAEHNRSRFAPEHNPPLSDFYSQIPDSKESAETNENKSSMEVSNSEEGSKSEQTEPASYNSYFTTGFRTAASALNPVVIRNDKRPDGEEGKTLEIKPSPLLMPLNMNVFPSPPLKTGLPRPVTSRIKEFFKNMVNQRY